MEDGICTGLFVSFGHGFPIIVYCLNYALTVYPVTNAPYRFEPINRRDVSQFFP